MTKQPVSFLTQSRFYSPAFNSAIFDGPFRIYFAQYQEALALKIYFKLQEQMKAFYVQAKAEFKLRGRSVFVMLYPSSDTFENCFLAGKSAIHVMMDHIGEDPVIGVRGPIKDQDFEQIFSEIVAVLETVQTRRPKSSERPLDFI